VTSEQAIILALIAAAFVGGWIVHALTGEPAEQQDSGASEPEPPLVAGPPPEGPPVPASSRVDGGLIEDERAGANGRANGHEVVLADAVHHSREALDRAVTDYHAAVALWLRDGDGSTASDAMFSLFGHDVVRLAHAVEDVSDVLAEDPLCDELRTSGSELRRLGQEVIMCPRATKLPPEVLDRSEDSLLSAASAISVSAGARRPA
jgi:hypothetical protein